MGNKHPTASIQPVRVPIEKAARPAVQPRRAATPRRATQTAPPQGPTPAPRPNTGRTPRRKASGGDPLTTGEREIGLTARAISHDIATTIQVGEKEIGLTGRVLIVQTGKTLRVGARELGHTIRVGERELGATIRVGERELGETIRVGEHELSQVIQVGEHELAGVANNFIDETGSVIRWGEAGIMLWAVGIPVAFMAMLWLMWDSDTSKQYAQNIPEVTIAIADAEVRTAEAVTNLLREQPQIIEEVGNIVSELTPTGALSKGLTEL